ncbi:Long-chain-fatty-acid CoA ligase (AMP-forming) [Desulfatibacillum aliphaticivorans]|uniref:Long-chain-fatty-acid CoA ligase (AMP-forming) n=1 Tax=Desulfatibacillum aliphaticivorans TaxID=218208 RepID=B8FJX1_DESAL|nr:long-chain fatty acid--CoA ligase [Desulfatibacillum aliphaticivorans]ACL02399.1 Long-chain-fatty-acid CoA ligase (AMP-forming) [Desulfatibacillum aliphaticivorans]
MEEKFWHKSYDPGVPAFINYPKVGAHEILSMTAFSCPNKVATSFFGTETTFIELKRMSSRFANALKNAGVKKGDRVGLHLPNSPQYIVAYYGALSLGAIVVNLNPMYTPEELTALCSNTGVSTLISFDMVVPLIQEVAKAANIERVIITKVTDFINGMPQSTPEELKLEKEWFHFSQFLADCTDTTPNRPRIDGEDAALIQFTGGTTGLPKGAVLTHNNLIAACFNLKFWCDPAWEMLSVDKRYTLSVLPFFHVYGDVVAMNMSIMTGATQIVVPRFDIEEIMGIIGLMENPMFLPAVPTMINAILNHPKAKELELDRRFTFLNSGGAPIAVSLLEQGRDLGVNMSEGWGMSETTSVGLGTPVQGTTKPGSVGIPISNMEIKLIDPEDGVTEVGPGRKGELLIKGPVVMKEYWDNPEETAGQLKDGWLHTGDVAIQDEEGYLSIVDRTKDMIIAGGYNIYPREIDEVLSTHPKVAEVVTVGIPDEYRGETVKAYVVPKPGQELTEQDIIAFSKEKLAPYKQPKMVEFREELPKSAVGKLLRKVLRAEHEAKKNQ